MSNVWQISRDQWSASLSPEPGLSHERDGRGGRATSPAEPIYELRQLRQSYNGRVVLDIEQLHIKRGEVLALVGPSGAGKSTLLRLLNFLEAPGAGTVLFQQVPFQTGRPMPLDYRRRVTTVFQHPHLLNRSVLANVQYGLRLRRRRETDGAVAAALELVGLGSMARQRARTLSGGEAQRVALARALVIEPEVLLLDEPTANLDPYNIGLIEDTIRRLNQEKGVTVVLVTHNIFQARRLAERVALLLEGKVVEIAPVLDFFDSPADPRTAAFTAGELIY